MDFAHLPTLDWQQATKIANGDEDYAKKMLAVFLETLEQDLADIHQLYTSSETKKCIEQLHKLHGALRYTGFVRLKSLVEHLELNLKNNIMDSSASLLDQIKQETDQVIDCSKRYQ